MMAYIETPFKTTNLVNLYRLRIYCVRCGVEISNSQKSECCHENMPPYCNPCMDDVFEEVDRNYAMWPNGWYGQAVRSRRHGWTVNGWKPVRRE